MANLNQSLKEAVCIDEEVFFGPISDKEKKIREQFEILHRNELREVQSRKTVEDDEDQNYLVYKSFSVDESKYDSFDDSLNEEIDKMPQEAKLITLKRSYDKIKPKRSGFYDSLEDVHSLVSNIDKCSISCEVENESNLNSKHFVEDSLKIPSVPVGNKNNFINDQVHFDDDSLAIIECETTFSDSLEEVNVLESIEIEEINDNENLIVENQNVILSVDRLSTCPPKNLFDTSVEIVCEKKRDSDIADQDESFDDKNLLYDSLSNSDFKEILTDSIEESEQLKKMLNLSKHVTTNVTHDKENVIDNQDTLLSIKQNSVDHTSNLFDISVQILSEKHKDSNIASPKESFMDKNVLSDSFSNSEVKDVSKDSLEESDKSNALLNIFQQRSNDNIAKSEDAYPNQNAFETSVQIIYDNQSTCLEKENIYEKNYNSKESFENYKCFQETSAEQIKTETGSEVSCTSKSICPSENPSENFKNIDADKKSLLSDFHLSEDNKMTPDIPIVNDPAITDSAIDISDTKKETFSVESCHLKILNDDINIDEDMKLQLHIEVTMGDKKCQIASQDIKIVPVISKGSKSELDSISTISVVKSLSNSISTTSSYVTVEKNENTMHLNNQELNIKNKDYHEIRAPSPSEINSCSHKKSKAMFSPNITQRAKSSASQISCSKTSCMDSFNDVSLLQALDLPDLSTSFLNESVIQSKDPLIPLNLYSADECIQNVRTSQFKNINKENIPEHMQVFENEKFCAKRKSTSPNKVYNSKTPQSLQKCSSFKETSKKTPGTKIPVRKVDNFAVPAPTPNKPTKPVSTTLSSEKAKRCQHSPHSVGSGKKTPGATPNKIPHICKVRNTIFSKVPQIIPSKKYMNVQSPVAQYIKNNNTPVKTAGINPVLRDCMNHPMESPHHLHYAHSSGSLKSSKKKA